MAMIIPEISFPVTIPKISALDSIYSPDIVLLNIPWQIEICKKYFVNKQWLAIYLHCKKNEQTPKWSCSAFFTVKLKSFDEIEESIEDQCDPYVCNQVQNWIGIPYFIEWCDLLDPIAGYVQNDTIELEIKIKVAQQNCNLTLDALDKHCENCTMAKYQLTVTNIDKLIAVRSPEFKLKHSPWTLTVYKSGSDDLAVHLESMLDEDDVKICDMRASFKLLTFKANTNPIETIKTQSIENGDILDVNSIISFKDLLKPRSSYIEKNTIKIEVKLDANLKETMDNDSNNAPKRSRLVCAICFERLEDQDVATTICGHLFCLACIEKSIEKHNVCPSCKKSITKNDVHRVYLPL